jgi:hypothetical protein
MGLVQKAICPAQSRKLLSFTPNRQKLRRSPRGESLVFRGDEEGLIPRIMIITARTKLLE